MDVGDRGLSAFEDRGEVALAIVDDSNLVGRTEFASSVETVFNGLLQKQTCGHAVCSAMAFTCMATVRRLRGDAGVVDRHREFLPDRHFAPSLVDRATSRSTNGLSGEMPARTIRVGSRSAPRILVERIEIHLGTASRSPRLITNPP